MKLNHHVRAWLRMTAALAVVVLAVCAAFCLAPASARAEESMDVNGSKTASPTSLSADSTTTTVTLSLPSKETTQNKVDIVFVMDHSNYANTADIDAATSDLLTSLESQTDLDVSIGVIKFDGWGIDAIKAASGGTSSDLLVLDGGANDATITRAITGDYSSGMGGSNTEQPIRMANAMLAAHGDADAEKYVVVLSDFHTYVYEGSATINGITYDHLPVGSSKTYSEYLSNLEDYTSFEAYNSWATLKGADTLLSDMSSDCMFFRYGSASDSYSQTAWATYWANGGGEYDTTPTTAWKPLDYTTYVADRAAVKTASTGNHMTGNQRSMLLTYKAMEASLDAGYNVIAYRNTEDSTTNWETICKNIPSQMLADIDTQDGADSYSTATVRDAFDSLSAKILYLVNSGTVTDVVGSDFDLVTDGTTCPFTLTYSGTALPVTNTGDNEWSFGTKDTTTDLYPYVVSYEPSAAAGEQITWTINVPVENAKQLSLSYDVNLTTAGVVSATYYTNESATLDYTSSDGTTGTYTFDRPSVNFTGPATPEGSDPIKVALQTTKAVTGEGAPDETFTFDLAAVTDGAPMPDNATASCAAGATATFGDITFSEVGTYEYTITEKTGTTDGMSYGTVAHKVVVKVEKGTGDTLAATVTYDDADSLTITNTYTKPATPEGNTDKGNDTTNAGSGTSGDNGATATPAPSKVASKAGLPKTGDATATTAILAFGIAGCIAVALGMRKVRSR